MDEIDRKLLGLLQEDATVGMSQLADQVGLSPTPVWKRIQKLEQAGVIRRRVALLEPERIGIGLIVFV
ncbi:MAG TPA: winged helix-turn-helix transcriptional regulator, partial [Acetobacteraceae bacterium]|nr:winged helix-turn-helix transcriptional regulator [Acetobacteraceae bacterium]